MILSDISDSGRYEVLHPRIAQFFHYLHTHDLSQMPAGRIEVDGENLFVNVCETTMVSAECQKLEVHRRYIDIHVPLLQAETIGWKHISELGESEAPFDEQDDYALYTDSPSSFVKVKPGEFLLVYPEDAHAPLIGEGRQRKLIAKVLL